MEVKGNVVILKNFEHVENYYEHGGKDESSLEEMKKNLRRNIETVLPLIKSQRLWFPICKVMMQFNFVGNGDFKGAAAMIEEAFPDGLPVSIDSHDLSKLNCESFAKDVLSWDIKNSPVGNAAPSYQTLALKFMQLF